MQVNAVGAAIDLRGADLHEVDQRLLEPKGVVFAPSSFRAKTRLIYFNAFAAFSTSSA
jgi:hypothetical protein